MLDLLRRNKIFLVYTPLVLYWLLILTLTSLPSRSLPEVGISDKISHLLAFFGLAVLLSLTFQFQEKWEKLNTNYKIYTFWVVTLYGFLDELHQLFIPGRSGTLDDWIADIVGGIIGIYFLEWFTKIDKKYSLFQK